MEYTRNGENLFIVALKLIRCLDALSSTSVDGEEKLSDPLVKVSAAVTSFGPSCDSDFVVMSRFHFKKEN